MAVCVHFAGFVGDVDEGAVLHAGFDETHFCVALDEVESLSLVLSGWWASLIR